MTRGVIAIISQIGESGERQQWAWKWITSEVSDRRGGEGWALID